MTGHYSCWTLGSINFKVVGPGGSNTVGHRLTHAVLEKQPLNGCLFVCLHVANCFQCGRRVEERHMERLGQDLMPTLTPPSGRTSCQMEEWARGVMMTKLGVSFTRTACPTL